MGFGVPYADKYWAVYCKRKNCRKTIYFALIKPEDPQHYPRVVALACRRCGERRRYSPLDIFRENVIIGHCFPITAPLFEE